MVCTVVLVLNREGCDEVRQMWLGMDDIASPG